MKRGWKELLSILPGWLAGEVDRYAGQAPQELRLRLGRAPRLVTGMGSILLPGLVRAEDLSYCVNTASRYSPWAATTIREGFLTAPGGHRIGLCGEGVGTGADFRGLRNYTSACIRIAADHTGIAGEIAGLGGSVLLIGRPGSGKTTLLRDLIRQLSRKEAVAVIDQRRELFPPCFATGEQTDVLTGCEKDTAVDMLLRTMAPDTIAMDEITRPADCQALLRAAWCGVRLIATAHAADAMELQRRAVYRPLVQGHVFDHLITLRPDKSFSIGRMPV